MSTTQRALRGASPATLRSLAPTPLQLRAGSPMTAAVRQRVANALDYAGDCRLTLAPISELWTSMSLSDAYVIQRLVELRKVKRGATVSAHKIGLMAHENRRMLGMTEITSGPIFAHQFRRSGDRLSSGMLIRPWLEAEVALQLGSGLSGPVTSVDVLGAARAVVPVMEVLDSRVSWAIQSKDSIADLASSGLVFAGAPLPLPSAAALAGAQVAINAGGRTLRVGRADAIGGIAHAAARLVNELGARGQDVLAGQLLLTGSLCAAVPLPRAVTVTASFGRLGDVSLRTV